MSKEKERLLIILSTGKQDHGAKATLAFAFACSALSMGADVAMYVTMDGTIWGLKEAAKGVCMPGFEPLESYINQFQDLGGKIYVCPPCVEYYCSVDKKLVVQGLRGGAEVTGMATAFHFIEHNGRVVTF
ncbi:MAG: DsrE family protein [Pseudomonadota bacterium]